MKKKQLNAKAIRYLKQAMVDVASHPTQFNMDSWYNHYLCDGRDAGGCGTAGCIFGWIKLRLIGKRKLEQAFAARDMDVCASVMSALGMNLESSHRLALAQKWPERFRKRHYDLDDRIECLGGRATKQRQQILQLMADNAAERIAHFIKTDGRE